jgi:hypothetical protein
VVGPIDTNCIANFRYNRPMKSRDAAEPAYQLARSAQARIENLVRSEVRTTTTKIDLRCRRSASDSLAPWPSRWVGSRREWGPAKSEPVRLTGLQPLSTISVARARVGEHGMIATPYAQLSIYIAVARCNTRLANAHCREGGAAPDPSPE